MATKQKIEQIKRLAAGHDEIPPADKALLDKYGVELYENCSRALLVTGTRKPADEPSEDEVLKINQIIESTGRHLHHIKYKILNRR